MAALNSDGLFVKYAREEGAVAKGGSYLSHGALRVTEVKFDYTDVVSATASITGTLGGQLGTYLPSGARIEKLEIVVETVFTSSGTLATSTLVIGLQKYDRSTELDYDGFTTTSFIGSFLTPVGKVTTVTVGSTGAGALLGTNLSDHGLITMSNSQHASHPFTAGKGILRVFYYAPQTIG